MKQLSRVMLVLVLAWACGVRSEEPKPLFLRLKALADSPDEAGGGSDMQIVGKFAYVAGGGLQIYSLADPIAPVWLGGYRSPLFVNALHVVGSYAYIAEHSNTMNGPGAFEIIDIRDPANPSRVGGGDTQSSANDIQVSGNFAFVAEGDRFGFPHMPGSLEIFDVAESAHPVRVATVSVEGSATSIEVSANYCFLADGVTDLQVFDVSDPARPQRVGTFISNVSQNHCGFEPGGPANLVRVVGNFAYSAGENGLHILDIRDPSNLQSIGDNFCFPIQSFQTAGNLFFATVWSSTANTYVLFVLDAREPANLVGLGTKTMWNTRAFQPVGNLVYAATSPFSVYELSDRPAITSLSIYPDGLSLTWEFAPGFVLQHASAINDPVWSTIITPEGATRVDLLKSDGNEFFRLVRP